MFTNGSSTVIGVLRAVIGQYSVPVATRMKHGTVSFVTHECGWGTEAMNSRCGRFDHSMIFCNGLRLSTSNKENDDDDDAVIKI